MRKKGSNNYSRKEVSTMRKMIVENKKTIKPMSLAKLSKFVAAQLNRPTAGVYYKMRELVPQRARRIKQVVAAQKPVQTEVTRKSVTFGKPTKIEISDNGMTFYF